MNLNFLQSILIGFVSGLAEMLPVSAEAHRTVLRTFFGVGAEDAVFRLLVHLACLVALNWHYSGLILDLRRTNHLMKIPPRRRKRPVEMSSGNTVKLLRNAVTVMLVCRIGTMALSFMADKLNLLPVGLVISGAMLLLPAIYRSGNMDARNMPRMNGLVMGFGGGLGVVPGISPVAGAMSLGQWSGVERSFALKFAHILLLPTLGVQILFDLFSIFTGGAAAFSGLGLLSAILGAAAAGFGCRVGLKLMEKLAQTTGFTLFAYYNWGAALLCFSLFLMI